MFNNIIYYLLSSSLSNPMTLEEFKDYSITELKYLYFFDEEHLKI